MAEYEIRGNLWNTMIRREYISDSSEKNIRPFTGSQESR